MAGPIRTIVSQHADHSHEEVSRTLASFSRRLKSQAGTLDASRAAEDSQVADSSSAAAPDAVRDTLYGSSPRERAGREEETGPGTAADSLTSKAIPQMHGILECAVSWKVIEAHHVSLQGPHWTTSSRALLWAVGPTFGGQAPRC